jgi:hypothetical protein
VLPLRGWDAFAPHNLALGSKGGIVPKQISTIKNPLTVIAIFAGIAEVSGSAVLPFISDANQETYIWFLMLFPFALITLFFMVLNWNHKVLYAPSDFEDEDHFVNILKKSSVTERVADYEEELAELETQDDIEAPEKKDDSEEIKNQEKVQAIHPKPTPRNLDEDLDSLNESTSMITSKADRDRRAAILKSAHHQSRNESRVIEKLLIERFEKELNTTIETDIKMNFGHSRYYFDGVARKGSNLTAIEIKFWRDMSMQSDGMVYRNVEKLESLYSSLTQDQKNDFSLIYAVVTDYPNPKMIERLKMRFEKLSFPVAVQVYDADTVTSDAFKNAS